MPRTLIAAVRAGRPEHAPESEPVVIETTGDEVTLILDDGESLTLDRRELLAAAQAEAA